MPAAPVRARLVALPCILLAACSGHSGDVPGDAEDPRPYAEIGEGEEIRFGGTEPFWGGTVVGHRLTYTTPENIEGSTITVDRFAGRGGVTWSGELEGQSFDLMITPGACSDGMSDRTYPFVATLQLGPQLLEGCASRASDPPADPA